MGSAISKIKNALAEEEEEDDTTPIISKLSPSAIKILIQIPGVTLANLQQWLYSARLLTSGEDLHDEICTYVKNSQCHGFGMKILSIIKISRRNQHRLGQTDPSLRQKTRKLLWHGTKKGSVPFILQHGFQPPPAKGQMFGKGIYFADRASKSARYCLDTVRDPKPGEVGYIFLCEVLLGKSYNARNAHHEYTTAPTYTDRKGNQIRCDSVKCTGRNIPDFNDRLVVRRNLVMPYGKTVANTKFDSYIVEFNEFIVYSGDQCKANYLVKVKFT